MIGVCTFIQKKKTKKKQKKKKKKKKQIYVCVSYLTPSSFFIIRGLGEIFMRDESCESSLRSFVPWIMTDMYLI